MLIWLPEFLGNNSNSLLKILEEPTNNTVFLLIAENKNLLLSTVLSRVQVINVPPIDTRTLAEHISTNDNINTERALYISNISNGNLRKAKIFCQEKDNPNENFLKNWMNICYKGSPLKIISWSEHIAKESRINQLGFLQYVSNILRQALLSRYGKFSFYSEIEEKVANTLINLIAFNGVEKLNKKINDSILHINRNANPKILFLNLSFQLNKMLKKS
jgi:DNA polymerase-3 subunit delta'